jgi:hypothetical protein
VTEEDRAVRTLGLLLGLFVLTSPSLLAGAGLAVEAPAVILARSRLIVETAVEPDSDNRAIQVIAESPEFYRSSEVQLNGVTAPRRNTFEFKDLPNGVYEIRAMLLGSDGQQRALVVRKLEVIPYGR